MPRNVPRYMRYDEYGLDASLNIRDPGYMCRLHISCGLGGYDSACLFHNNNNNNNDNSGVMYSDVITLRERESGCEQRAHHPSAPHHSAPHRTAPRRLHICTAKWFLCVFFYFNISIIFLRSTPYNYYATLHRARQALII